MKGSHRLSWAVLALAFWGGAVWGAEARAETSVDAYAGYKLVGVIEGAPEHAAAVFEETDTRAQRLVRVGDRLGGAAVIAVEYGRVWLKKDGSVTVVRIRAGSPAEGNPSDPIDISPQNGSSAPVIGQVLSKIVPPYDPRVEGLKRSVPPQEMDRIIAYLQKFLEPASDNGTGGFLSTPLGNGIALGGLGSELRTLLGLEAGDVIVGISGMGLDSADRLKVILEVLPRASVFDLSILRNGTVHPLYFSVSS